MKLMSKNGNAEYPGNHRGRLYPTHIHASPVYGTGDPRGPYTGRYFSEGASEAEGTKGTRKGPDPAPNRPCLSIHRKFSKNLPVKAHKGPPSTLPRPCPYGGCLRARRIWEPEDTRKGPLSTLRRPCPYGFFQFGLRFSRKACMPSWASGICDAEAITSWA